MIVEALELEPTGTVIFLCFDFEFYVYGGIKTLCGKEGAYVLLSFWIPNFFQLLHFYQ